MLDSGKIKNPQHANTCVLLSTCPSLSVAHLQSPCCLPQKCLQNITGFSYVEEPGERGNLSKCWIHSMPPFTVLWLVETTKPFLLPVPKTTWVIPSRNLKGFATPSPDQPACSDTSRWHSCTHYAAGLALAYSLKTVISTCTLREGTHATVNLPHVHGFQRSNSGSGLHSKHLYPLSHVIGAQLTTITCTLAFKFTAWVCHCSVIHIPSYPQDHASHS